MLKIGFADYYLDNWHANYYPSFMRDAISQYGYSAELTCAYAFCDKAGGLTTEEWCDKNKMKKCRSMEEMLDSVDAIMVIAADNSEWHPYVAKLPLTSGKPVFVDKTFAPSYSEGVKMFEWAEMHRTPVFSSSAQRYCPSITNYLSRERGKTKFMSTVGPHDLSNYAVHQFEPIVAVMGTGVRRVKSFSVGSAVTQLILDYGDNRIASFTQTPNPWAEFNFMVSDGEKGERLDSVDFYIPAMKAILDFFNTGIPPVSKEETLEILALIDAAKLARQKPDIWLDMSEITIN